MFERGVASCLFRRARTIPKGDNVQLEEEHLRRVLKDSGFPAYIIEQAARQKRKEIPLEEEEGKEHNLCLPYIAGLGEDLRRICKKYKIRTCFRTHSTLRRQLTKVKDKEPPNRRSGVVYSIPCSCGLEYIGEPKRALETRIGEHQAAVRRGETEKSAVADHAWTNQHHLKWENTTIIDGSRNKHILQIKEALHIQLAGWDRLFNRDSGTITSECWRPILMRHCKKHSSTHTHSDLS